MLLVISEGFFFTQRIVRCMKFGLVSFCNGPVVKLWQDFPGLGDVFHHHDIGVNF